jgi:hypothetical protein
LAWSLADETGKAAGRGGAFENFSHFNDLAAGRSERIRTSDPVVPNGWRFYETRLFAVIDVTLDAVCSGLIPVFLWGMPWGEI